MHKYDGAIFDLDGTLVDSMWVWEKIDLDFLGQRGLTVPEDIGVVTAGMSFTETAGYFKDTFQLKESVEEIKALWIRMAVDYYSHEVLLKPGALELLNYFKERNIKIGLATSCSRELLTAVLQQHQIDKYFEVIVTSCEVDRGKPHPDVYLKTAEKLSIMPEKIIAFEDTVAGAMSAKSAGMTVVGLYDEYSHRHQEELKSTADFYLKSMTELFVNKLHKKFV